MNMENITQKYIDGVLHTLCGCGTCGKWFVAHKNTGDKKKEVRFVKGHYCIGKHPTKESIEKNRRAHLGRPSPNKGKTPSAETREKIRIARAKQVMKKGRLHTAESKEKNRLAHLGRQHTEESKRKLSLAITGQKRTDEQKRRLSECRKGDKNPSWLGGISKLPYTQDWTDDLRDAIRKRDGYKCQICGIRQSELSTSLDVHHIDYNKENCNPNNLVSLCKSCHIKTNRKRNDWTTYFIDRGQKKSIIAA
jgi:hypothetical protein